jgi:hypothetical protein
LEGSSERSGERLGRYFFSSEVSETLKSSRLLRLEDPPTEAPAEATIQAVLPVLAVHDCEGSDEGSNKGSGEVEESDGDPPNDDGDNHPGFDFLLDEEEDGDNNASYDDGSLLPHRIEIRCPEASDDEESDGDNHSVDAAENVVEEDEPETYNR